MKNEKDKKTSIAKPQKINKKAEKATIKKQSPQKSDNKEDEATEFQSRVYGLCSKIPKGSFATYNDIAKALKTAPRAVGQALKRNKRAPMIPCHRVLKTDMSLGGYLGPAAENIKRKKALLESEGLLFDDDGLLSAACKTKQHRFE